MITTLAAIAICSTANYCPDCIICEACINEPFEYALSDKERDRIYREMQFASVRMHRAINMADRKAREITNVDTRELCVAAIQGTIGGMAGKSAHSIAIGGCLGAVAHLAGNSTRAFLDMQKYLEEAYEYAYIIEDMQDRLNRDK